MDLPSLLLFLGGMLLLVLPFWPLQLLRGRGFREPFLVYICLLWFLSFFTGAMHFSAQVQLGGYALKFRFSSAIYTLIFAGLVFVYIAEGINEARKVIAVSVASQTFLVIFQVFLYLARGLYLPPSELALADKILEPRAFNLGVSFVNTVIMLFVAVVAFQFLVNYLRRAPLGLNMFLALWATMMLDSVVFIALTRPDEFSRNLAAHAFFKTMLLLLFVFPLAYFLTHFRRASQINLKRGTLDIFKKLENLEKDLELAHTELQQYAQNLEKMVEDRTKEIRAKSDTMRREMELASEVQNAMLPSANSVGPFQVACLYRPCHEVSGDLYDYAELPDGRIFVFIADISGHGVPSALVGAMCKMSLGSQDFSRTNAGEILKKLSEAMKKVTTSHYLTGTVLLIDPRARTIEYANGAHIPCLLQSASSAFLPLEATGTIIGSFISAPYDFRKIAYPAGTRLILLTDGIVEQKNADRHEFGQDRFQKALTETRSQNPAVALGEIWRRSSEFAGTDRFSDDVTLLIADLP